MTEGIRADAAASAQFPNLIAVDDREGESEFLEHLTAPFAAQRRRAEHEDRPNAMPQEHLLQYEPRLDRLAEPYVVGNQEVYARHVKRADDRVELVVFDRYPGPERGLEGLPVGRGDCAPANGVEKRGEALGVVETIALRHRKRRLFEDERVAFEVPKDPKFVAEPVVVDGR
jgi:hypothetical protein